jgi:hypothetical protein
MSEVAHYLTANTTSDRFDMATVALGSGSLIVPQSCKTLWNGTTMTWSGQTAMNSASGWARGGRYADGYALYTGFNTVLPPNSPSCNRTGGTTSENDWGAYNTASRHVGGVQSLFGDGAVRFISENIDAGNPNLAAGITAGLNNYGVFGALGTKASSETVGEF